MNWKKWPKLLEHQSEILSNDYKGLLSLLKFKEHHLDWGCPICEFEEDSQEEVEEAIRQYAKSRTWPLLSPVGGAMLRERIGFAKSLMTDLQWCAKHLKMGAPAIDMDEEETICWFLIDAWEQFGFDTFMNNMRAIPTRETHASMELGEKLKKDFFRPQDNLTREFPSPLEVCCFR